MEIIVNLAECVTTTNVTSLLSVTAPTTTVRGKPNVSGS